MDQELILYTVLLDVHDIHVLDTNTECIPGLSMIVYHLYYKIPVYRTAIIASPPESLPCPCVGVATGYDNGWHQTRSRGLLSEQSHEE